MTLHSLKTITSIITRFLIKAYFAQLWNNVSRSYFSFIQKLIQILMAYSKKSRLKQVCRNRKGLQLTPSPSPHRPARFLVTSIFYEFKKTVVKWKMVKITKLVETPQRLLVFLTLLLTSTPEMGSRQQLVARDFLIFNRSLTITLRSSAHILFIVDMGKKLLYKCKCNHSFINVENSRSIPGNWNVWLEM